MVAHGSNDSFFRELQVLIINGTAKGRRIFDKISDFIEQVFRNGRMAAGFCPTLQSVPG